jgi:hypothetical protein
MTNLGSYMDACIKESQAEEKAKEFERVFHRKIYLTNLIERAEKVNETAIQFREMASNRNITPVSRHRMSKELAEELLVEMGDRAYLYCLEKLANDKVLAKSLWRDVLTHLDEMKGKPNET